MLKKLKNNKLLAIKATVTLALVAGVFVGISTTRNDLHNSSVMIVNRAMTSGGTGIVYRSTPRKSYVLTNAHVCRVVEKGGVVVTPNGQYQVNSIKKSLQSDLCVLTVLNDLKVNTMLAKKAPKLYDEVKVSGHPALMPNIVAPGHLSGSAILPVLSELRACNDEDMQNPDTLLYCIFFGGVPVIKFFESTLVSSTIMPGSSGSGVYNASNKLIGVVFAGSGDFGYGWIVPYEQVKNFLEAEEPSLQETAIDQRLFMSPKENTSTNTTKALVEKCRVEGNSDPKIKFICSLITKDMLWRN